MACYGVLRYHVLKSYHRGITVGTTFFGTTNLFIWMVLPFGWLQDTPNKMQLQLHQPFHGVRNGKA